MEIASSPQRVAFVTGASRGIGRACALRLGADGFAVALNYGRDAERADAGAEEIRKAGGTATVVAGDVADVAEMERAFDRVESELGGVDVVVHAAGQMKLTPLAELDLDEFDALHRVNVRGTVVVDQQAARRVRAGGSIINFSTSVVGTSPPSYGAYAASKGAVEALTRVLANELRGRDVTANAVAPGPTMTELFIDGKSEETLERLAQAAPLGRLGQPEDIAGVVALLASPSGHWVNGQVLRVNGGMV